VLVLDIVQETVFTLRVGVIYTLHYSYMLVFDLMFVVPYMLLIYMFNLGPTACILYYLFLSSLALYVSGAICTHHQEHKCRVQP
jgi:hypothetical protein